MLNAVENSVNVGQHIAVLAFHGAHCHRMPHHLRQLSISHAALGPLMSSLSKSGSLHKESCAETKENNAQSLAEVAAPKAI
jgi:hypothetical protein